MKKIKIILIILLSFIFTSNVSALNVNDTINNNEYIEVINTLDIFVNDTKININNFISNKWRTYVKLNDLCSGEICSIDSKNEQGFVLTREYKNVENAYYEMIYTYENNSYDSKLKVNNYFDFNFGEKSSAPDVSPVIIDNELYVPIRFIVEALGAEVIYDNSNASENAKVYINFYSDIDKDFNVSFKNNNIEYNYKDLEVDNCYDVSVNTGNKIINNPKLFSNNTDSIKIDYNDNTKTNICINNTIDNNKLYFVFNYNSIPIIYTVDINTINANKNEEIIENIDKLYITGNISSISKENEGNATLKYVGKNTNFDSFIKIKWQGTSSIAYEKKNYTIKLYETDNYSNKYKLKIGNWPELNKYVLKANYNDYSQARNVVGARIWGQVVKSRKNVNPKLATLVNGGAIDGYPVLVYINGQSFGLYTFNIPKTEELFDMTGNNEYLIMSNGWDNDSLFKSATVDFDNPSTNWEALYKGDKTNDEVESSINRLIDFTINNDGDAFKNGIGQYLDIDATIDYIIYLYYTMAGDNVSKNILWATYDGTKWFPSMYDMDSIFGNGNANFTFYDVDAMLPAIDEWNNIDSATPNRNLLWTKMLNNFRPEIKSRYFELRNSILTTNNVKNQFENFRKYITEDAINENNSRWPNLPNNNIDNYQQIYDYTEQREKLLDNIINNF